MINWTKDNTVEWIAISDKLIKEWRKRNEQEKKKSKVNIFKKKK